MDKISWASPSFWGNEKKYVNNVLDSLWISGGEYINNLENSFAELYNKKYALTTSNGTTSLHLIYLALGLKPGDEIIVPGFAFLAAANIATQMNIKPVFVDVDPDTWCVTDEDIYKKITKRTKAIVPIHTYGNVCEMQKIINISEQFNIPIIEDCAESLFSKINNRYSGTFGKINSFSFQATKTITTGEGGMVMTDDDDAYKRMILYRSHGLIERGKYWHEVPGHNFRLTNLQAALGFAQFEKKDNIIDARKNLYNKYKQNLAQNSGVKLQSFNSNVDPVVWATAIQLDNSAYPQGRDQVIQELKYQGIETRPGFVASSLLKLYDEHKLNVAEHLSNCVISLPSSPVLSDEQITHICSLLQKLKK